MSESSCLRLKAHADAKQVKLTVKSEVSKF